MTPANFICDNCVKFEILLRMSQRLRTTIVVMEINAVSSTKYTCPKLDLISSFKCNYGRTDENSIFNSRFFLPDKWQIHVDNRLSKCPTVFYRKITKRTSQQTHSYDWMHEKEIKNTPEILRTRHICMSSTVITTTTSAAITTDQRIFKHIKSSSLSDWVQSNFCVTKNIDAKDNVDSEY